jgi:hypothetical protein
LSTDGSGVGSGVGFGVRGGSVGDALGSTLGGSVGAAVGHGSGIGSDPLGDGNSNEGTTPLSFGVGTGKQLTDGSGVRQLPPPSSGPQLCPYGMYRAL